MGPDERRAGDAVPLTGAGAWAAWAIFAFVLFLYLRGMWPTWRRWWIEPPPAAFFRSKAGRLAWGVAGCLAFWPFALAAWLRSPAWAAVGFAAWVYLAAASAYGKRLESRPRDVWEHLARESRETHG